MSVNSNVSQLAPTDGGADRYLKFKNIFFNNEYFNNNNNNNNNNFNLPDGRRPVDPVAATPPSPDCGAL